MADSLNTPTLPKIHQAISRRSMLKQMAAGTALTIIPMSAMAAPVASLASPWERLNELIAELQVVAREINPAINEWKIITSKLLTGKGCPLLIAAFENPETLRTQICVTSRFLDRNTHPKHELQS